MHFLACNCFCFLVYQRVALFLPESSNGVPQQESGVSYFDKDSETASTRSVDAGRSFQSGMNNMDVIREKFHLEQTSRNVAQETRAPGISTVLCGK